MATSVGSRVGLAVLLTVLVATASTSQLASASQITFFQNMGCTGNSLSIVECGQCFDMIMFGGYDFVYSDGQPVTFYSSYGCNNKVATVTRSESSCGGLKFDRSIKLGCSSSEATAAE